MSVSVTTWQREWREADLERTYTAENGRKVGASAVKHVLLALSTWADYEAGGNARPGVDRLVKSTNLSPQVVRWALQTGRTLGWVKRTSHKPGTRYADVYALAVPPGEGGD